MYKRIQDILKNMSEEECEKIFSSDDYDYISSIDKGDLVLILIKLMKELS